MCSMELLLPDLHSCQAYWEGKIKKTLNSFHMLYPALFQNDLRQCEHAYESSFQLLHFKQLNIIIIL